MKNQFYLSSLALPLLLGACAGLAAEPGTSPDNADLQPEATLHTWTSSEAGFFTNSHWLDTGKEVIVFDAQFTPEAAGELLADIRKSTASPVRYVIITHPNPDKFNGASVFQELGATLVASQATSEAMPGVHDYKKAYFVGAGAFSEESYPALPRVDLVFDKSLDLALDGTTHIQLQVLDHAGVSSTQTLAWIEDSGALIVGDLIHPKVHAWLEGGIVEGAAHPTLDSWQEALGELRAYAPDTIVYPGRGAPTRLQDAVDEQQEYLSKVEDIVKAWADDVTEQRAEASDLDALSARVHQAFPSYAMGFMTNYSIYALAARALE
jgi:glyoxylase-like metal-dependent hydrolase (beta-lactamase superfamily II)